MHLGPSHHQIRHIGIRKQKGNQLTIQHGVFYINFLLKEVTPSVPRQVTPFSQSFPLTKIQKQNLHPSLQPFPKRVGKTFGLGITVTAEAKIGTAVAAAKTENTDNGVRLHIQSPFTGGKTDTDQDTRPPQGHTTSSMMRNVNSRMCVLNCKLSFPKGQWDPVPSLQ